jgi:hypothetical protein
MPPRIEVVGYVVAYPHSATPDKVDCYLLEVHEAYVAEPELATCFSTIKGAIAAAKACRSETPAFEIRTLKRHTVYETTLTIREIDIEDKFDHEG